MIELLFVLKQLYNIFKSKELMFMEDFGRVYLNLEALIKEKGISKTQLSYSSKISHTQLNRFCKGEASRIDFNTLAKLCSVLDCKIEDLIIYEPPKD